MQRHSAFRRSLKTTDTLYAVKQYTNKKVRLHKQTFAVLTEHIEVSLCVTQQEDIHVPDMFVHHIRAAMIDHESICD